MAPLRLRPSRPVHVHSREEFRERISLYYGASAHKRRPTLNTPRDTQSNTQTSTTATRPTPPPDSHVKNMDDGVVPPDASVSLVRSSAPSVQLIGSSEDNVCLSSANTMDSASTTALQPKTAAPSGTTNGKKKLMKVAGDKRQRSMEDFLKRQR